MPRSHALLAGLFDYAGLFPPSSLSLDDAVARYAAACAGPFGWMLGRFVLPAAQLEVLGAVGSHRLPQGEGAPAWRLSVLAAPAAEGDAAQVTAFNRRAAGGPRDAAIVDTVEVKVGRVEDVRAARGWASRGFEVYCEVPLGEPLDAILDAVAHAGLHAKLRAGGVTPGSVPSCADVAAFLCGCVARGVVAKATAGLHHPVTGEHPLGPDAGDQHSTMLGFLNLVLAAGIAEGAGRAAAQSAEVCDTVAHLLSVTTPPSWIGHAQVEWCGPHGPIIEGPLDTFVVSGRALIRSIGTCSFDEPVEGARRIGLLP